MGLAVRLSMTLRETLQKGMRRSPMSKVMTLTPGVSSRQDVRLARHSSPGPRFMVPMHESTMVFWAFFLELAGPLEKRSSLEAPTSSQASPTMACMDLKAWSSTLGWTQWLARYPRVMQS